MESTNNPHFNAAQLMNHEKRKHLALTVIKNKQSITHVADNNNVSRQFIHVLKDKAIASIDQAFKPKNVEEEKVLFYLPVTKLWLCQFILCLLLHCRSSFRCIMKVLNDVFDYQISICSDAPVYASL